MGNVTGDAMAAMGGALNLLRKAVALEVQAAGLRESAMELLQGGFSEAAQAPAAGRAGLYVSHEHGYLPEKKLRTEAVLSQDGRDAHHTDAGDFDPDGGVYAGNGRGLRCVKLEPYEIALRLEQAGFCLSEVAGRAGVSMETLFDVINHRYHGPRLEEVRRAVCGCLKVDYAFVWGGFLKGVDGGPSGRVATAIEDVRASDYPSGQGYRQRSTPENCVKNCEPVSGQGRAGRSARETAKAS